MSASQSIMDQSLSEPVGTHESTRPMKYDMTRPYVYDMGATSRSPGLIKNRATHTYPVGSASRRHVGPHVRTTVLTRNAIVNVSPISSNMPGT